MIDRIRRRDLDDIDIDLDDPETLPEEGGGVAEAPPDTEAEEEDEQ